MTNDFIYAIIVKDYCKVGVIMPVHKNRYFPDWDGANRTLVRIMHTIKPRVFWDGKGFDICIFPPVVQYMIPLKCIGRFNLCWRHFWGIISKNIDYNEMDRIACEHNETDGMAYAELEMEQYIQSVMPSKIQNLFCLIFGVPITIMLYEDHTYKVCVSNDDLRAGGDNGLESE